MRSSIITSLVWLQNWILTEYICSQHYIGEVPRGNCKAYAQIFDPCNLCCSIQWQARILMREQTFLKHLSVRWWCAHMFIRAKCTIHMIHTIVDMLPFLKYLYSLCFLVYMESAYISDKNANSNHGETDSAVPLTGRPYGDCCMFYKKSLAGCVSPCQTASRRLCVISVQLSNGSSLLLVNVYFPIDDGSAARREVMILL